MPKKTSKRAAKAASAAPTEYGGRQFIIQVHAGPQGKVALKRVRKELVASGVRIDSSYPPVNVNPVENNFVLRGWATPDSRSRAEKIPGVQFFGDPTISIAS